MGCTSGNTRCRPSFVEYRTSVLPEKRQSSCNMNDPNVRHFEEIEHTYLTVIEYSIIIVQIREVTNATKITEYKVLVQIQVSSL